MFAFNSMYAHENGIKFKFVKIMRSIRRMTDSKIFNALAILKNHKTVCSDFRSFLSGIESQPTRCDMELKAHDQLNLYDKVGGFDDGILARMSQWLISQAEL